MSTVRKPPIVFESVEDLHRHLEAVPREIGEQKVQGFVLPRTPPFVVLDLTIRPDEQAEAARAAWGAESFAEVIGAHPRRHCVGCWVDHDLAECPELGQSGGG